MPGTGCNRPSSDGQPAHTRPGDPPPRRPALVAHRRPGPLRDLRWPHAVEIAVGRATAATVYRCRAYVAPGPCGKVSVLPGREGRGSRADRVSTAWTSPAFARRLTDHPDPERAALLPELAESRHHAPGGRALGRRRTGRGDLGVPPPRQGPRRCCQPRSPPCPKLTSSCPRSSWSARTGTRCRCAKRAFLERYVERVVVLPSTTTGRPRAGVTTAQRVGGRLDPARGRRDQVGRQW